jgi:hypothetical protein
VDHKSIGQGTDSNGPVTVYTVSVRLFSDDPVNHVSNGETFAYVVSKTDWDMLAPKDFVKIEVSPNAQAQVNSLIPNPSTGSTPEWRLLPNTILPLNLTFTADNRDYVGEPGNFTVGETANFTLRLVNDPALSDGAPSNVSLCLFKECIYYVFFNGELFSSNDNTFNYNDPIQVQSINLQPNQEVNFTLSLDFTNFQPGYYYIRAYVGYYSPLEAPVLTLTQTILIGVSK